MVLTVELLAPSLAVTLNVTGTAPPFGPPTSIGPKRYRPVESGVRAPVRAAPFDPTNDHVASVTDVGWVGSSRVTARSTVPSSRHGRRFDPV